jgi:RHS repeat-associated protein
MKLARLALVLAIMFGGNSFLQAQTAPNFENGWKPYGSYDGTHLDTVNLMNGNVMFHGPLMPDTPQRGSLKVSSFLYSTSQDWQVQCNPGCKWVKGGAGVFVEVSPFLKVRRTIDMNHVYDNVAVQYSFSYTITTESASVHKLHGVAGTEDQYGEPTQFDSIDLTGYHLVMSNPDASTGVLQDFTIADRSGNKFVGTFHGSQCTKAGTYLLSTAQLKDAILAPVVDDASVGEQYCNETALTAQVTDPNGNQISTSDPSPFIDTLGKRPGLLSDGGISTDPTGCVSSYPILSAMSYDYQDPNGVSQDVKFCYSSIPIQTAFNVSGVQEGATSSTWQFIGLMSVVYPNGTYWGFTYDNYGEPASIHLPTGGTISYTWTTVNHAGCGGLYPYSRAVQIRTADDGRGDISVWRYNWGPIAGGVRVNTVTDPAGNDTAHTFTDLVAAPTGNGCKFYETSTVQYQGASGNGNKLQKVDTTYSSAIISTDDGGVDLGNVFATDVVTTVYPSGKVKKVHKVPDAGLGAGLPIFGNVVKELEYDWRQGTPGALLRETDTVYKWQTNSSYLAAHLIDLPASTVVISPVAGANLKSNCPMDAAGNIASCMAETDYTYDEPAYLTASSVITQHGAPPAGVRGNQSTVSHWLNTTNGFISSHTNWYDTGEVYQKIDPLGHTTTHTYDPAYVGGYATQTCSPSTSGVSHCVSGTYDFNTGLLTSLTNENATTQAAGNTPGDSAHTSNYSYDSMFRLTSAQAPPDAANSGARAQNNFYFSAPNVFPVSVQRTKSITNALSDSATSFFDGLGRGYKTQHALPNGTANVDTTFDADGHPATVSNPYFSTSDPTYGTTASLYDALDRVTQVTKQDGGISSVNYNVAVSLAGDCTDTTDEAGKQRRTCSDALGRLIEVDEPNPGAAATSAQASITINGTEQTNPLPGLAGSGSVIVSGVEGTSQVCNDAQPPHQICHNVPDGGTIGLQVGTYPANYVTYFTGSTGATLASALAGAFHNDSSSPVDAVIDPANSAKINFTARSLGVATNYAVTYFNGADFTFSGLTTLIGGRDASTNPDAGTVSITVNGTAYSTSYNGSDTGATIATRLASAITAGTLANASASDKVITLTAKSTGQGGDYALSAASTYDSAHFGGPSFTPAASGTSMANGYSTGDVGNQPFVTLYQYDALGNLLRVDQKGTAPGDSTQWRTRTFTYDSLSRLLTANNPESGTISYVYDADGSLMQKTSPAPNQTGAATQTVSYCYDVLHRVTGKGYGAQSCPLASPVVSYVYDSGANAKGKLVSLTDQAGTASYTYDTLGRLSAETRSLIGAGTPPPGTDVVLVTKNLSYEYNLDGSLKTLHYPSGAAVTYTPDSAGRILSAVDSGNNINYATGATYGPDGALTGFVSGYSSSFAGIANAFAYNKRLQPLTMSATAPSQTVYSIGYDFHYGAGNNGNVFGIYNYKDANRNQTFTYDALNRLTSAQNAGTDCTAKILQNKSEYWGNNYTYDAWGNMLQKSITKCGAENLQVTADAHNWIHASGAPDYQYDAAGNMTYDATASLSYTFDQENRLTGAGGYTYTYDGDGNRVRKSNGNTAASGTLYWDMTPGVVAETDLAGTTKSEYVFFDGERVARRDGATGTGGVFYYFSDHLKTASVITDSAGVIKAESDYYPWGGELQFVNNDTNDYKFTGKKRDIETGLDYFGARYYSNGLGRWVSADWSSTPVPVPYADFGDPQSLNLYNFVGGNPASKADPDGHEWPSWSDVGHFVLGAMNAYGSDGLAGAGRADQTTTAGKLGAAVGDGAATLEGVGETILGAGGEVLGVSLDLTGAGALVGVPINLASAGVIAHGATTAVVGGVHLAQDANQSGGVEPYNRKEQYGNTSSSQAAKAARAAGEGQPCPKCGKTQTSGGPHAPQAEHSPTLKQHWFTQGRKMSPKARKDYAKSAKSLDGSNCRTCQAKQGGQEKNKKY